MTTNHHLFPLHLTTLSPLHIGNGESLTSTGEYLCTSDRVYFLRHEDLMKRLKADNHFDDYVQQILDHELGFDFYKTLSGWGINAIELAERTINLHQQGLDPAANNILHLCIKTNGKAYVPGSSIKGLLRTAIIFKYLKEHPQELKSIEAEILALLERTNSLHALKKYWEKREMEWTGKKKKDKDGEGLIPDKIFQAIRPYDSDNVEDDNLVIEQANRQALYGESTNDSEGLDWLVECIGAENTLPFELVIFPEFDGPDFAFLQKPNIKELFGCINDHTRILIAQERQLINISGADPAIKQSMLKQLDDYEKQVNDANGHYAIARMGKGKTLFFQTILPLLKKEAQEAILDLLKKEPGDFPRSRVLTVQDRLMMGWVKLEYKKPERKLFANQLATEIKIGTPLKAHFVELKKVDFILNAELYEGVQMINDFKQNFPAGEQINVIVHQMSKAGKIVQVKLNQ